MMRAPGLACLFVLAMAGNALAAQSLKVKEDGTITFRVSVEGITRVSLQNDRIRRLVNNGSNFEMTNDEETGDMFIRFVGSSFVPETGFLIAESGATINYVLTASNKDSETVVIDITGGRKDTGTEAVGGGVVVDAAITGSGHKADIAAFLTRVWRERIGRRSPRGSGQVDVFSAGGLRARIHVVRGGTKGAVVTAQNYYRSNVVAVLVEHAKLAPGQSTWVIVVEQR